MKNLQFALLFVLVIISISATSCTAQTLSYEVKVENLEKDKDGNTHEYKKLTVSFKKDITKAKQQLINSLFSEHPELVELKRNLISVPFNKSISSCDLILVAERIAIIIRKNSYPNETLPSIRQIDAKEYALNATEGKQIPCKFQSKSERPTRPNF